MTEAPQVEPKPPFPSFLMTRACEIFTSLEEADQRCLDEAIMGIECDPRPEDAVDLEDPNQYSVIRCGYVVSYTLTDAGIDIWDVLPRE